MDASILGFRYYPFDQWDANQDTHLEEYFLVPDASSVAWKDIPTMIFAPRGGGKTALRVYTERVCSQSMGLTFAVTHIPNEFEVSNKDLNFTNLTTSIAKAILRYLISEPNKFLKMSNNRQREIVLAVKANLSIPLNFLFELPYSSIIRMLHIRINAESQPPRALEAIRQVSNDLDKTRLKSVNASDLFSMIQELIGVKSIYVLLDGVDGFYETGYRLEQIQTWLTPLIEQAKIWNDSSVYLKAFLPLTHDSEHNDLFQNNSWISTSTMIWNDKTLAELIRRRVAAASDGKFESLDEKCELKLRDLESIIVNLLPDNKKLPREALVLTDQIIKQAVLRSAQKQVTISLDDVDVAHRNYLSKLPQINSSMIELV